MSIIASGMQHNHGMVVSYNNLDHISREYICVTGPRGIVEQVSVCVSMCVFMYVCEYVCVSVCV